MLIVREYIECNKNVMWCSQGGYLSTLGVVYLRHIFIGYLKTFINHHIF